jgi:hypothetical protein
VDNLIVRCTSRPRLYSETAELVTEIGLRAAPMRLSDRAAFRHATGKRASRRGSSVEGRRTLMSSMNCYHYYSCGSIRDLIIPCLGAEGFAMSVALWSGSTLEWDRALLALKARLAPVFGRAEVRASVGAFIDGLLSGISRKTGWLMAEQAGLDRPYRMQSLLGRSSWSADALSHALQLIETPHKAELPRIARARVRRGIWPVPGSAPGRRL